MKTSHINNVTLTEASNSELLKEFETKISAGPVHFIFKTQKGERREAFGTIHPDWYIKVEGNNDPHENKPENKKEGITVYYDLEKLGWRSFINENLIVVF